MQRRAWYVSDLKVAFNVCASGLSADDWYAVRGNSVSSCFSVLTYICIVLFSVLSCFAVLTFVCIVLFSVSSCFAVLTYTVVAKEIGNNHFGPCLKFLGVM